jgi:uncharacterized lipoprotein
VVQEHGARVIELGDLSSLCGTSRMAEIRRIVSSLKSGEEALIVTSDPDTWYSLANLGEELGYEVVESTRSQGRYSVRIRIK